MVTEIFSLSPICICNIIWIVHKDLYTRNITQQNKKISSNPKYAESEAINERPDSLIIEKVITTAADYL